MRTWRCDGIAQEKIGTEAFARGLFVSRTSAPMRSAWATSARRTCTPWTMGSIRRPAGWGYAVGDEAGT